MTTYNTLIGDIAVRAKELANMSMDDLRQVLSSDEYGSVHAARQEFKGWSRGRLVEAILYDEYCTEFDFQVREYVDQ